MLGARIDLEFVDQLPTQPIFWQHPLNGLPDKMLWLFFQHFFRGSFADTAGIVGMAKKDFFLKFFPVNLKPRAFMTITKSPASRFGVKIGLFFPRNIFAISLAMRP